MIRLTQVYKTFDGGRSNAVKHLSFSVDILEKRNLVKRTRISNVQRKIHLEVTDAGVEFIEESCSPPQADRECSAVRQCFAATVRNSVYF